MEGLSIASIGVAIDLIFVEIRASEVAQFSWFYMGKGGRNGGVAGRVIPHGKCQMNRYCRLGTAC